VTLEEAMVTVAPPPALWLFASGMLGLFGFGRRRGLRTCRLYKRVNHTWLLPALALTFPAVAYSSADINGDAIVTSQDISILASCFGQSSTNNSDCAKADVDEDGDIDGDDLSFVSERLGQAYPETILSTCLGYPSDILRYLSIRDEFQG
jgi:hypothetical protein